MAKLRMSHTWQLPRPEEAERYNLFLNWINPASSVHGSNIHDKFYRVLHETGSPGFMPPEQLNAVHWSGLSQNLSVVWKRIFNLMQLLLLTLFDLGPIFIFFCVIISEKKETVPKTKTSRKWLTVAITVAGLQCGNYGLSWTIMDFHWLSQTITDYHRLSKTIMDYQGLSQTIMDYQGLSWTIMDYHGLSWNIMEYMDYHGLSWTIMDFHGLSWTIMD